MAFIRTQGNVLHRLLVVVIALIIYGSTYPWNLIFEERPATPLWILLHSWDGITPSRFPLRDFVDNVALYVPLGIAGCFTFRNTRWPALRIAAPVTIAGLLSSGLEMIQIYDPLRYCNALDVFANLIGTVIGLIAANAFIRRFGTVSRESSGSPDPIAIVLLICWTAYLLFPGLPEVAWSSVVDKWVAFAHGPVTFTVFLSAAATWFVLARLVRVAAVRSPAKWLFVGTLLIPLQLVIASRQPASAEFAGAVAGGILATLSGHGRRLAIVAGYAIMFVIVARNASLPITGQLASANDVDWVPFAALLDAEDWQNGFVLVFEKVSYFGLAIWMLHSAGARLRTATLVTAGLLACVESWQWYLPGSAAETTDPLLALLLGYVFACRR